MSCQEVVTTNRKHHSQCPGVWPGCFNPPLTTFLLVCTRGKGFYHRIGYPGHVLPLSPLSSIQASLWLIRGSELFKNDP